MMKHQRSTYRENIYEDGFDLSQCDVGMDHEIVMMASAAAPATSSTAAGKAMKKFNAIACPIVS
jgi:hypothetical protein